MNRQDLNSESGFDMKSTVKWYGENPDLILSNISFPYNTNDPYAVLGHEYLALTPMEIWGLISHFPVQARKRSILRKITGKPTLWFSKESTGDKPKSTSFIAEALSPTSLVPGYTDASQWRETSIPAESIELYEMPASLGEKVSKIVHLQALVHEFAHTIVDPALYIENYKLRLPNSRVVESLDFVLNEFAQEAERLDPISHYANAYRDVEGLFRKEAGLVAITEELVESITAHILGFSFREDESLRLNPLYDRPQIKQFVGDFLNSTRA